MLLRVQGRGSQGEEDKRFHVYCYLFLSEGGEGIAVFGVGGGDGIDKLRVQRNECPI